MESMAETYKAMMGIKRINQHFDRIEEIEADDANPEIKEMLINIHLVHIDLILIKHE